MAIASATFADPGVGITTVTGTFSTDAAAPLTCITSQVGSVGRANNPLTTNTAGIFPGRYLAWPGAGAAGADAILACLGTTSSNTVSVQSPGIQTESPAGTTLTAWEVLKIVGMIRAFTITAANGDAYSWSTGDPPYELKYTPNGSAQTVLPNAVIVAPEQIHFAPGILPASTTYAISMSING